MKESEKLLKRYISGEADPLEQTIVEKWYAALNVQDTSGFNDAQKQQQLELIKQNLPGPMIRKVKLWPRIAIAAALFIAVFGASLFYFSNQPDRTAVKTISYANDIAPGKEGATLTLANGEKISINNTITGDIARQGGVKISKAADGSILYEIRESRSGQVEYNSLSTARGQRTRLRLPDGSLVFLNAGSSLRYPTSFTALKNRQVDLEGEAFFQIEKDEAHPFIVKTKGQHVTVLGTHFNIKAYKEEASVITTLLEGSVRVNFQAATWNDNGKVIYDDEIVLSPGQESLLQGESISIAKANLEENMAWKEGDFIFTEKGIESIMRDIARWYNIQIVYEGSIPTGTFSGNVSRSKNISQILRALESTKLVHFKVEGRKVYVSK